MGTIIIGSSANRKGITVNPSEVFFNGNVVKAIMSGVVTIWDNAKALVPIMTSNTTPYGEVSAKTEYSGDQAYAWKAFNGINDGSNYNFWRGTGGVTNNWIQYKFIAPTNVTKVYIKSEKNASYVITGATLQASNDGNTWTDLESITMTTDVLKEYTFPINNGQFYLYYRVKPTSAVSNNIIGFVAVQFYGKQLVGLVPTMTSNTSPSGIVSASSESSTYQAWKAFDGISGTSADTWITEGTTNWIQYQFDKPQKATMVSITNRNDGNTLAIKNFTVQGSDNGTSWTDLGSFVKTNGENVTDVFTLENNTDYLIYRISIQTCHTSKTAIGELQFYK